MGIYSSSTKILLYRSGTSFIPNEYTDIVTFSQGERGILEFTYKYPGPYMFHAHKTEFAEKGWAGMFLVKEYQTEADKAALSKGNKASYPAELSGDNNNSSGTENKVKSSLVSYRQSQNGVS